MSDENAWETQRAVQYIISEVAARDWVDPISDHDDFAQLRHDRTFREAATSALYEEYFPPRRHETDWQILSEIVGAVVNSPLAGFAANALASSIIGGAGYDLFKSLCRFASTQFKVQVGDRARSRANPFEQMANNAEALQAFFATTRRASIAEIEHGTKISREKLYPLLKIAGLRQYRSGSERIWELP